MTNDGHQAIHHPLYGHYDSGRDCQKILKPLDYYTLLHYIND